MKEVKEIAQKGIRNSEWILKQGTLNSICVNVHLLSSGREKTFWYLSAHCSFTYSTSCPLIRLLPYVRKNICINISLIIQPSAVVVCLRHGSRRVPPSRQSSCASVTAVVVCLRHGSRRVPPSRQSSCASVTAVVVCLRHGSRRVPPSRQSSCASVTAVVVCLHHGSRRVPPSRQSSCASVTAVVVCLRHGSRRVPPSRQSSCASVTAVVVCLRHGRDVGPRLIKDDWRRKQGLISSPEVVGGSLWSREEVIVVNGQWPESA